MNKGRALRFWTGQRLHGIALVALLLVTAASWQALGRPHPVLFGLSVLVPIMHQVYVWFVWRSRLVGGAISTRLTLSVYLVIFFTLFFARFITLGALAWADRGSLAMPTKLRIATSIALLLPGLYAGYSTLRYFGMKRAAGADHFFDEYRRMPLVTAGIFRFTSNGMYAYAFLLFWALALSLDSSAALVVAAYSHAYVWVHYYATEKPDMEWLYGRR